MKFKNWTHAAGAFFRQAKPSEPPIIALGSPEPPLTAGNANQPRSGKALVSGVREAITPGSHAPMSSMAALWLASMPAELPAPCWAEVVRKPVLNGSVEAKAFRSSPALVQQGSEKSFFAAAVFMASLVQSRSAMK